jgi:ADP-heptose:LPS heptosyltransferase
VKKFLIIRFSSIGDIVLTTPIVRCLKKKFPDCSIHFLTKSTFATLVSENPNIDKVFVIERSTREVLPALKKENYDHIIDLHKNLRSKKAILELGVHSTSYPKLNVEKFLMVKFKMDILPKIHIVDRYFKAVEELGVSNDGEGLSYFIPSSTALPVELPANYNVLVVGAAHATKTLTEAQLTAIAQQSELPVVLLGGKKEEELGARIMVQCGQKTINFCGAGTLHQSALILKNAHCVVTPDTGMMHIASAFHKKIISVWGSTIPEFGMYPYLPKQVPSFQVAEVKGVNCRPCSKIGYKECPKGHFKCIREIDIAQLITAMNAGLLT